MLVLLMDFSHADQVMNGPGYDAGKLKRAVASQRIDTIVASKGLTDSQKSDQILRVMADLERQRVVITPDLKSKYQAAQGALKAAPVRVPLLVNPVVQVPSVPTQVTAKVRVKSAKPVPLTSEQNRVLAEAQKVMASDLSAKQKNDKLIELAAPLDRAGRLGGELEGRLRSMQGRLKRQEVVEAQKTKAGAGGAAVSRGGDKDKKETQKTDAALKTTKLTPTASATATLPEAQKPELETLCDKCNFIPKEAGVGCSIKKNGDQLMMSSGDGSQAVNLISRQQSESLWSEHAKITKSDVGGGYYKTTGGGADIAVYRGGKWNSWKVKFDSYSSKSKTCNVEVKTDLDPMLESSKQTKNDANTFLNPSKWSEADCKDNVSKFRKCGIGRNEDRGDLDIDRLMTDGKGNYYVLAENGTDSNGKSEIRVYKATKSGMKLEKMATGTDVAENGDLKYGRKGLFGKVGDFFGGKHGMTSIAIDDIPAEYSWVKDRVTHQCSYKSAIEKLADKQSVCKDLKQQKQQQETEDMLDGTN